MEGKIKLHNFMEYVVFEILESISKERNDFCKCERCKLDIAAIALNNLRPHYTVTEEGEVYAKVQMLIQQFKTDAIIEILKAIEIVSRNPHH